MEEAKLPPMIDTIKDSAFYNEDDDDDELHKQFVKDHIQKQHHH